MRARIPINCTIPAVGSERAHEIIAHSGCRTAKVKIADHSDSPGEDLAHVETVRDALETSVGLAAQLALAGALPELDFACGLASCRC
ncbi:L-alanine-DL-glutamate epimerase-like enolase superfamily enzyme [Saccharothrix ecbatanensis]|uniref:L-alanine-DL-glutamate epimerase-like enolase superfamily enzyme n=1 Tax=Saccharothrix ecbatanensis TaxID=1105145 RepID=A0A7W9HJR8_9PSEU|nr:L-alanine-DL-glutamate epimerase-like enolase superfamily enzyme [Saccharothrix ecbatanensis]